MTPRFTRVSLICAGLGLVLAAALASGAVLQQFDFEQGADNWVVVPEGTPPQRAQGAEAVKSGQFSLQCGYTPTAMQPYGLGCGGLSVGEARTLRLWLRSSAATTFLLQLTEKDGSNYNTTCYAPANEPQDLVISLGDFRLGDDSQDENNQLDPDQLEGFAVLDAAGFIASLAEKVGFIDYAVTPRFFWLDAVAFEDDVTTPYLLERPSATGRELLLADFERALVGWAVIGTGTVALERDPAVVASGQACLRLETNLPPGKACLLIRGLSQVPTAGVSGVRLKVRAPQDSVLIIGTSERDGSDYNMTVELKGAPDWQSVDALFADFQRDENSQDENGKLDADQIKHVALADVTGTLNQQARQATLWFDDLVLLKP